MSHLYSQYRCKLCVVAQAEMCQVANVLADVANLFRRLDLSDQQDGFRGAVMINIRSY